MGFQWWGLVGGRVEAAPPLPPTPPSLCFSSSPAPVPNGLGGGVRGNSGVGEVRCGRTARGLQVNQRFESGLAGWPGAADCGDHAYCGVRGGFGALSPGGLGISRPFLSSMLGLPGMGWDAGKGNRPLPAHTATTRMLVVAQIRDCPMALFQCCFCAHWLWW